MGLIIGYRWLRSSSNRCDKLMNSDNVLLRNKQTIIILNLTTHSTVTHTVTVTCHTVTPLLLLVTPLLLLVTPLLLLLVTPLSLSYCRYYNRDCLRYPPLLSRYRRKLSLRRQQHEIIKSNSKQSSPDLT